MVLPQTVFAECKTNLGKGKICPDILPNIKEYKSLRAMCANGCYLVHPEDYVKAKHNEDRVALIPSLKLSNETLLELARGSQEMAKVSQELAKVSQGMTKDSLKDKDSWRAICEDLSIENTQLRTRAEDAWSGWEKVGGVAAGVLGGVILLGGTLFVIWAS